MNPANGKGSKQRPLSVTPDEFASRWDQAFINEPDDAEPPEPQPPEYTSLGYTE